MIKWIIAAQDKIFGIDKCWFFAFLLNMTEKMANIFAITASRKKGIFFGDFSYLASVH